MNPKGVVIVNCGLEISVTGSKRVRVGSFLFLMYALNKLRIMKITQKIVFISFVFVIYSCQRGERIAEETSHVETGFEFVVSGDNLIKNPGFEILDPATSMPQAWTEKIHRDEIAPEFAVDNKVSRSGNSSVRISANGSNGTFGYWMTNVEIQPDSQDVEFSVKSGPVGDKEFLSNRSYLFGCFFKTKDIESTHRNIWIRFTWIDKNGRNVSTGVISNFNLEGEWYRVSELITAPKAAASLAIELALQWTATGTVWWDNVSLVEHKSPEARIIKLGTVCRSPEKPSTPEANRLFFADKIIKAGEMGVDLLCMGEGITVVATGKKYVEVAETVPGPTSQILGDAARKAGLYVAAGIYEREGELVYNTVILIDRNGDVVGKYRKTHLPQTEVYGGITPETDYPVFETEFGKVGVQTCYDNFFPEVTRILALKGAEIILLPIWGDPRESGYTWDIVARARAIDNSVFFVASIYGRKNLIISPNGHIIANDDGSKEIIAAEVDLNMRTFEPWLSVNSYGEFKNLFPKERCNETYKALVETPE